MLSSSTLNVIQISFRQVLASLIDSISHQKMHDDTGLLTAVISRIDCFVDASRNSIATPDPLGLSPTSSGGS